ncbi:MAG TPA: hypothetical protein VFT99_22620, partial [Roseiflexaceae bacterium]|nr:hypothetical protein [Roseiflexaceae bacterium]
VYDAIIACDIGSGATGNLKTALPVELHFNGVTMLQSGMYDRPLFTIFSATGKRNLTYMPLQTWRSRI